MVEDLANPWERGWFQSTMNSVQHYVNTAKLVSNQHFNATCSIEYSENKIITYTENELGSGAFQSGAQ